MSRPRVRKNVLVLSTAPVRLASLAVACAVIAGLSATEVEPPAPEALASSASLGTASQETPDATRSAIERSTTTVATRAAYASPAVSSLPATATTSADLPVAALNAYERAEQVIGSVRPGCHLSWPVLAAVGQVESDHGRSSGGDLDIDGTTSRVVRGAVLDGSGSTAKVADTDGGQLDGVTRWDRAVGPMQFLPSTWIAVRVDGDDDGVRSADDIDDASLAAAVFLCAWGDDLSSPSGATKALGHFSSTPGFAPAVLSLARTYQAGSYLSLTWSSVAIPTWSTSVTPAAVPAVAPLAQDAGSETRKPVAASAPVAASQQPSTSAGSTATAGPEKTSSASPSATPTQAPTGTPSGPPSGTPSQAPSATPATTPTSSPSTDPSPSESPAGEPSGTATPSPDPTPSGGGTGSAGSATVAGTLQACGDGEFCIGDRTLDLGDLDTPAAADFDGDGTVGSKRAELTGLVGNVVTVTLDGAHGAVLTLDALTW